MLNTKPVELSFPVDNASEKKRSDIIQGDIIDVLDSMPQSTEFDVIIADPPYNIGKNFGNNNDSMLINEYIKWSKKWLSKCFSFLKKDGLIYVYGFSEILARIATEYDIKQQRWLVWHYTNKTVPSSAFWQRSHESILCLWKSNTKRPNLKIDQIREPYTKSYLNCAGSVRKETVSRYGGKKGKKTIYNAHEKGALPRDVIKVPALAGGAGASERWFLCRDCNNELFSPKEYSKHQSHDILKHPTQKPMELTKRLILSCIDNKAPDKGNILIPFAGSGSECVVAQKLSVNFTAIEINPEYVYFARKWLKKAKNV